MTKKELLQVNIHDDYCLWNMIVNATNSIGVLQDYIMQHRGYDNGKAYAQYKKILADLRVFEDLIAKMPKKKED